MAMSTPSMRPMTCEGACDSRASARVRVHTSRRRVRRCSESSIAVARCASTLTCPERTARVVCHCSVSPSSVAAVGSPSSCAVVSSLRILTRTVLSGSCFSIASIMGPGTDKASRSRISLATSSARRATSGTGMAAGAASSVGGATAAPDCAGRVAGASAGAAASATEAADVNSAARSSVIRRDSMGAASIVAGSVNGGIGQRSYRGGAPLSLASRFVLRFVLIVVLTTVMAACATPVGVTREDPKILYRTLSKSVLSADSPSSFTEQLLRRRGLDEEFERDPEAMLAELHRTRTSSDPERLFALAELRFIHGRQTNKPQYVLASAVYAYAFLASPERRTELMPAADPRVRWAVDLYNVALTFGLMESTPPANDMETAQAEALQEEVLLTARTLDLPFGRLELQNHPDQFSWGGYRMTRFIPLIDYKVRGLRNRYRVPGIGMPLAAEVTPLDGPEADKARKRIPPRVKVPVTAFVRFDNIAQGLTDGQFRGTVELHALDEATSVEAEGVVLPLELDPSGALALMLEGAPVWDSELAGFLRAGRSIFGDGLIMMHPYRKGRIPVVLVHGTASSPARWADIVNEIQNDPGLRSKFQVWLFMYNTSNPILLSAERLRTALRTIVTDLDPDGQDPALRNMVVMGHSQGGMLTRLMVTDSGNRFWANVTSTPLDDLKLTPESRELLQRVFFFKPVPTVKRVVFLATPHQGSFRVGSFVLAAVRRIVTLPLTLVRDFRDILQQNPDLARQLAGRQLPTAVDNMRPGHPFVRTLSESPIAPGVVAHSIVAVRGTGDVLRLNDGVVAYRSAHLEGVESEKIVQSSHSLQSNPATLLEVRRILREHLEASATAAR